MTDLITAQIIRNRISSLMDEMDHSIFRSGYSTIVRESHDFSVIIADHEGRLLIAPRMFLHSFTYYHFVQTLLGLYGAEGIAEGDVFVEQPPLSGRGDARAGYGQLSAHLPSGPDDRFLRGHGTQSRLRRDGTGQHLRQGNLDVPGRNDDPTGASLSKRYA